MIYNSPITYQCAICHGLFVQGSVCCCVAHPPGTCCHYGDTPVIMATPAEKTEGQPWR